MRVRKLACGWWWSAERMESFAWPDRRVALVVQFDPGDEIPATGVKVLRMTAGEAEEMAAALRVAASGEEP